MYAASLLVVIGAAFSPNAAVHHARPLQTRARGQQPAPSMVFYQRDMTFSSISDPRLCISEVYRLAEQVCSWTAEEWDTLNAAPFKLILDPEASKKIGGVVVHFVGWGGQGRDGRLEIELVAEKRPRTRRLVWTSVGSRRVIAEDTLFKLVLEEVRRGSLRSSCKLALLSMYPRSTEAALGAMDIENQRLRKQLKATGVSYDEQTATRG